VRNDPLNLVDPTGNAPNKEDATDYRYVASQMEEGGLAPLRQEDREIGRYFQTETYGWVDVRHFSEAAAAVLIDGLPPAVVLAGGVAVELEQTLMEGPNDYSSAFSPEDLPSNQAGVDFAEFVNNGGPGAPLSESFERWARAEGAAQFGDQTFEDAFDALPEDDPSKHPGTSALTHR